MHYNTKSESYGNIQSAFEHEAAGHVRYMILEEDAKKRGNVDLANIYGGLAKEEYNHAKIWYRENHKEDEESELTERIADETNEAAYGYANMAAKAELEGYEALADKFLANGKAEAHHRDKLMKYRNESKDGSRYHSHEDTVWCCGICGHRHTGLTPPEECPLCGYGKNAYARA